MAKPRKPIPKHQLTLSEGKHSAFEGIEDRGIQTNPNAAIMPMNPNYQDTGIAQNRSSQMSMKDDTTKQYSVGLKDIDAPDAIKSCPKQMEFGIEVRDYVSQKLENASSIKLTNYRKTNLCNMSHINLRILRSQIKHSS